jgi:hypothetical protein
METGMIKGMPLEWFAGLHILTADEVRHLPLNTAVMIISKDRYGIKQVLDYVVRLDTDGIKKYLVYESHGARFGKNIRETPRKVFAVKR